MPQHARELHTNGFAFLPRHRAGDGGDKVVSDLGLRLAGRAGCTHYLAPAAADAQTPNSYSGQYGFDEFPFHTDLAHHLAPPRYLFLRCVRGHQEVRTLLIDGATVVRAVGASLLIRALVQPRRPRQGARPLLSLWDPHARNGRLRWDREYLKPASTAGVEAMSRMTIKIAGATRIEIPLCQAGDTLIIDNWRMLHARSAVPEACRDRIVERAYLEDVY